MVIKNNCCKDCERKGCGAYHDICEKYQAYRAELAEEKEKTMHGAINAKRLDMYVRDTKNKMKRGRK